MKNNEKLLYTIGETPEEHVPDIPAKSKGTGRIKWAAIGSGLCAAAAILAVVLMGGTGGGSDPLPNSYDTSDTTSSEPEQNVSESTEDSAATTPEPAVTTSKIDWAEVSIYPEFNWESTDGELVPITPIVRSGGMGFEGFRVNDPSELIKEHETNPWTPDMELEALPVFRNPVRDGWLSQAGFFIYLSEEQMNTIAENVAYVLGTEITSADTGYEKYVTETDIDGVPTPEQYEAAPVMPYDVAAQCADGTEIRVSGDGGIRIELGTPVHFPEGCGFDTPERENAAMEYLAEKYSDLLQFENPAFFVDSGTYQCIYDKSGDEVQQILNYNMYFARFCIDLNGDMYLIYFDNGFVSSEYLGDYPIISLDEAQEMLLEGKYLTTVSGSDIKNGVISAEDIAYAELVYRCSSGHDDYYQPYYRFYVELDMGEWFEEEYPGMTDYGAFYVPAVSEEYLSELTVWNGSFN